MAHTNTQLSQWLESKVGQTLDIRKGELTHDEEISDLDQIVLEKAVYSCVPSIFLLLIYTILFPIAASFTRKRAASLFMYETIRC